MHVSFSFSHFLFLFVFSRFSAVVAVKGLTAQGAVETQLSNQWSEKNEPYIYFISSSASFQKGVLEVCSLKTDKVVLGGEKPSWAK